MSTVQDVIESGIQHTAVGAREVGLQGEIDTSVSQHWYNRPDDERFLDLKSLYQHCKDRSEQSKEMVVSSNGIRFHAFENDELAIDLGDTHGHLVNPSHWAFGQACKLVGAPAGYLRTIPAKLAGICLQYGYTNRDVEQVGVFAQHNGHHTLRAMTGPTYGRIHDMDVARAVMQVAGNGTGDTKWKVPGVMSWGDHVYDPNVPITKSTTTLFASDRDVYMFLCDDTNPIEIGKLKNGEPDLVFRGFYVSNSEVGNGALSITTMLLRAVCQNRILWGVQNQETMRIVHSSRAPERFITEAGPALDRYAAASALPIVEGIQAAKNAIVAESEEDGKAFLKKKGYTMSECNAIINQMFAEEGEDADISIWNLVQGATANARRQPHQDERIRQEKAAARLMAAV